MVQDSIQGHDGKDGEGRKETAGKGRLGGYVDDFVQSFFWTATGTIRVSFFSKDQ